MSRKVYDYTDAEYAAYKAKWKIAEHFYSEKEFLVHSELRGWPRFCLVGVINWNFKVVPQWIAETGKGLVGMAKTTKTAWAGEGDLTLDEAAAMCGLTREALKKAVQQGRLSANIKRSSKSKRRGWHTTVEQITKYIETGIHKQGRPRKT